MSTVLISLNEASELLEPINKRLEVIEENQRKLLLNSNKVFSDKEASDFLRMSCKKLQTLRNNRKIGFVREEYGRKITYKMQHLIDYLNANEIKAKK